MGGSGLGPEAREAGTELNKDRLPPALCQRPLHVFVDLMPILVPASQQLGFHGLGHLFGGSTEMVARAVHHTTSRVEALKIRLQGFSEAEVALTMSRCGDGGPRLAAGLGSSRTGAAAVAATRQETTNAPQNMAAGSHRRVRGSVQAG